MTAETVVSRKTGARGRSSQASLGLFMRELGRHPLLDEATERTLALAAQQGDGRAFERLVNGNLRLVVKIASQHAGARIELGDLVQEGAMGLCEAVRRFDPTRGVRLGSYAAFWIRAYVLRALLETARLVRVDRTREGRSRFWQGTLPPAELSLDAESLDGETTLGERLPGPPETRPDALVERAEITARARLLARSFARTADDRERAIVDERLLADEPTTLLDIASRFHVTKERMRQIEQNVLATLRSQAA